MRSPSGHDIARRRLIVSIGGLLVLQAAYFWFLAWSFATLFRGARNTSGSPLPSQVWWLLCEGAGLLLLAALFVLDWGGARRTLLPAAVASLFYGLWAVAETLPSASQWYGVMDITALECASGVVFVLLGGLGVAYHVMAARR